MRNQIKESDDFYNRLVPAIRLDKTHTYVGQRGQVHVHVAGTIPDHVIDQTQHVEYGFVDTGDNTFYNRKELGGLHSQQLMVKQGIQSSPSTTAEELITAVLEGRKVPVFAGGDKNPALNRRKERFPDQVKLYNQSLFRVGKESTDWSMGPRSTDRMRNHIRRYVLPKLYHASRSINADPSIAPGVKDALHKEIDRHMDGWVRDVDRHVGRMARKHGIINRDGTPGEHHARFMDSQPARARQKSIDSGENRSIDSPTHDAIEHGTTGSHPHHAGEGIAAHLFNRASVAGGNMDSRGSLRRLRQNLMTSVASTHGTLDMPEREIRRILDHSKTIKSARGSSSYSEHGVGHGRRALHTPIKKGNLRGKVGAPRPA